MPTVKFNDDTDPKEKIRRIARRAYGDNPTCRWSGDCDEDAVVVCAGHLAYDLLTVACEDHAPRHGFMYGSQLAPYPGADYELPALNRDYEHARTVTAEELLESDRDLHIDAEEGALDGGHDHDHDHDGDGNAGRDKPDVPVTGPDADGYDRTVAGLQRLVRDVYGFTPECRYNESCDGEAVAICAHTGESEDSLFVACEDHAERVTMSVAPVRGAAFDPTFGPENLKDTLSVVTHR